MELFYKEIGEGPALIILHGLFGTSDNWQTLAKKFSIENKVYLIDQRNHGRSFHNEHFDYTALTNDLLGFYESKNIGKANILGHSMGGKVAMKFTALYPDLVEKLIVADIAPRFYPVQHKEIINALNSLDLEKYDRREEVDKALSARIKSFGIRQFLLKNLNRQKNGKFIWKINLNAISNNLEQIGQAIYPEKKIENETLFISGSRSDYITENDISDIKEYYNHVSFVKIEKAGHWLHAEAPEAFYKTVSDFLRS